MRPTCSALVLALGVVALASCRPARSTVPSPPTPSPEPTSASSPEPTVSAPAASNDATPASSDTVDALPPKSNDATPASSDTVDALPPEPPPPTLPKGVAVGEHTVLPVPNDHSLHVYHAAPDQRRAIVYLHGVCGNVHAVRSWARTAVRFGTLIELVAESPCQGRPGRYAWKAPVKTIVKRAKQAVEVVREARGGLLDTNEIVLFGYSQGAARAQAMAHEAPERFPWVVLGSPPGEPDPLLLSGTRSVLVLGGSEEGTSHLRTGVHALQTARIRVRYVSLPGAAHGQYGPKASEVIDQALTWLLEP